MGEVLLKSVCNLSFMTFKTVENQFVPVVSVVQGTVYAADGGGRRAGFFCNFQIGFVLLEHGRYLEALGQGQKLVDRAEILEKIIALFLGFQTENSLKKMVDSVGFDFFIHSYLHVREVYRDI